MSRPRSASPSSGSPVGRGAGSSCSRGGSPTSDGSTTASSRSRAASCELPPLSRCSSGSTAAPLGVVCKSFACEIERDYELTREVLGTGASGDVREARCRSTRRPVAVKSFQLSKLSAKQRGNLAREAGVHSRIDHPHVARLEAVYETERAVHLVLEHLAGGELFHRMTAVDRLGEPAAAAVCAQLLRALAFLHARGIVHRDVKPENILFEEPGSDRLKLIDFGFACYLEAEEARRQMCGTVQYVAPEVLQRQAPGTKSDVWSAGSVLYTTVTGRVMYGGDDTMVLSKNKTGAVDYARSFATLSQECQRFVRRLLTVDPEARPSAAEALEDPWLRRHAPELVAAALEEVRRDAGRAPEALRTRPSVELRLEPALPLAASPPRPGRGAGGSPKADRFPGIISMLLPYFLGSCIQAEKKEACRSAPVVRSGWSFLPSFAGLFKDLALCAHADSRRS